MPRELPPVGADGVTRLPFPGHNLPKEGVNVVVDAKVAEGVRQTEGYAGVIQGPGFKWESSSNRGEDVYLRMLGEARTRANESDAAAAIADDIARAARSREDALEELAAAVEGLRAAEARVDRALEDLRERGRDDE